MKRGRYKVILFASSTEKGRELAEMIGSQLPDFINDICHTNGCGGIRCDNVKVLYPGQRGYDPFHFHIQERRADLIIFDGSIEESEDVVLGDNYMCVPHAPYMNTNVLVVSRTVLPLNFIPHTSNVLPFGENFMKRDEKTLIPIRTYSNESIFAFIKDNTRKQVLQKLSGSNKAIIKGSSVKKDPLLFTYDDNEKIAFISYRSHYNHSVKCGGFSVQDLERHILSFHHNINPDEKWKVLFYPPGGLSQDCPTEYLRWALLTYVENVFIHVDEVWIFNSDSTDEKSYWDSWYTQGEYLSLMSVRQGLPERMPRTYMFNPHTGEHQLFQIEPSIPSEEKKLMSQISANSDVLWGDYAALRNIILTIDDLKEKGINPPFRGKGYISEMLRQHPYSKEFLTNRIFSCPSCVKTGHTMAELHEKTFIQGFIQIGYNTETHPGNFVINEEDFKKAEKDGFVKCPSCHRKITIRRNPDNDFFLWKKWTNRTNRVNDWYIEKIPAFDVE